MLFINNNKAKEERTITISIFSIHNTHAVTISYTYIQNALQIHICVFVFLQLRYTVRSTRTHPTDYIFLP